jgi:hypothetical protein
VKTIFFLLVLRDFSTFLIISLEAFPAKTHAMSDVSHPGGPCQSPQPDVSVAYERGGMDVILDPVLHITPEFHKLCEESSKVLPLEVGSSKALVTSLPQSPASLVSGPVLAHSSDALFAKELCGLLASLEAASPGYGKDIACVLAGKASKEIIRKVEKSLRTKRKKMVFTWKVPQLLLV